jgi:hypothetical protein
MIRSPDGLKNKCMGVGLGWVELSWVELGWVELGYPQKATKPIIPLFEEEENLALLGFMSVGDNLWVTLLPTFGTRNPKGFTILRGGLKIPHLSQNSVIVITKAYGAWALYILSLEQASLWKK